MKCKQLAEIHALEARIAAATPAESARLTKKLVKLKDDWLHK